VYKDEIMPKIKDPKSLQNIKGIGKVNEDKFKAIGIDSLEKLAEAPDTLLNELSGDAWGPDYFRLSITQLQRFKREAKQLLKEQI
jgi:predicted RecB family nuclease